MVPPAHDPAWHVSPWVQAFSSSHAAPSFVGVATHLPAASQRPVLQASVAPLHGVPTATGAFVQTPPAEQTPVLQLSAAARQVAPGRGTATHVPCPSHTPALHSSAASLHGAPEVTGADVH